VIEEHDRDGEDETNRWSEDERTVGAASFDFEASKACVDVIQGELQGQQSALCFSETKTMELRSETDRVENSNAS
jgi:hypothetical protein